MVVRRQRVKEEHAVAQLVEPLRYKSRVQFSMVSLQFFIDIILPYNKTGRASVLYRRQKESWQTSEETSRYVRPERVNKWPNSMTDMMMMMMMMMMMIILPAALWPWG